MSIMSLLKIFRKIVKNRNKFMHYKVYEETISNPYNIFTIQHQRTKQPRNVTNINLMLNKNAPHINIKGTMKRIELHHYKQNNLGPLLELASTIHSTYNKQLHPYKYTIHNKHPKYPVDRKQFNKDRHAYWKNRGITIISKSGNIIYGAKTTLTNLGYYP